VAGGMLFDDGSTDGEGRAYRLKVSPRHADTLAGHVGKPIVLGLRPQSLRESSPIPPVAGNVWHAWKLPVRMVELLGDTMDVYCSTPRHQLVARVPSHAGLGGGSSVVIAPAMDEAYWFEPGEFGRNLIL